MNWAIGLCLLLGCFYVFCFELKCILFLSLQIPTRLFIDLTLRDASPPWPRFASTDAGFFQSRAADVSNHAGTSGLFFPPFKKKKKANVVLIGPIPVANSHDEPLAWVAPSSCPYWPLGGFTVGLDVGRVIQKLFVTLSHLLCCV